VTLESSSVAANCAMNRERQLAGVNSYARELGLNPLHVMRDVVENSAGQDAPAAWLDLCCGTGRARSSSRIKYTFGFSGVIAPQNPNAGSE
jgi:hypothetical protein